MQRTAPRGPAGDPAATPRSNALGVHAEAIASVEDPSFLCLKHSLLASAPHTEQLPTAAPVDRPHPQDSSDAASFTRFSACTING